MWVEISAVTKSADTPTWDINPRPVREYEVRLVVWNTKDIVAMDFEGTSDVFFKAFFD